MDFENEEQQIEAIKTWLKKNGLPIVLGIVVVVAGTIGWRGWQQQQYEKSAQASAVYEQMMAGLQQSMTQQDNGKAAQQVQAAASKLVESWPDSTYADYAHLALAKQAVVRGDYDQAAKELTSVADQPATEALGYTASLRLARVYLAADKPDAALKLAKGDYPQAWQGESLELKGDILQAQQQAKEAQAAYELALSAYGKDVAAARRLQMKLNQLKASL